MGDVARQFPEMEDTHRQNSKQRRLACVLQSDHGDVHLGGPTATAVSTSTLSVTESGRAFAFDTNLTAEMAINRREAQSWSRMETEGHGHRTRRGAGASRRCAEIWSPWPQSPGCCGLREVALFCLGEWCWTREGILAAGSGCAGSVWRLRRDVSTLEQVENDNAEMVPSSSVAGVA